MPKRAILTPIDNPELVIGLCAPIGTDLDAVISSIETVLKEYKYNIHPIKVSQLIKALPINLKLIESPVEKRYESYMTAGNKVRKAFASANALALLSVTKIRNVRSEISGDNAKIAKGSAFVLNQLKRPEEIDLLREVYGPSFICISISSSRNKRLANLTNAISRAYVREKRHENYEPAALRLIIRDEEEEEEKIYGQRVRDAFALADVVVDGDNTNSLETGIKRFFSGFFGSNSISPTPDELFMSIAYNIALQSADLSRQVGAVLVSEGNQIISTGCNEVPKAQGGAYWHNDPYDQRDFLLGRDPNQKYKEDLVADVFRRLKPWLSQNMRRQQIESLVQLALYGEDNAILKGAHLMDLLEFGRVVHAEMHALSQAAMSHISTKSSTLYCTTFPCHNCARHIIAAGVSRVVFIEPYTKSAAIELYPDSIEFDSHHSINPNAVNFQTFVGVAPSCFRNIFRRGKRKDTKGNYINWDSGERKPRVNLLFPYYLDLETAITMALDEIVADLKLQNI